SRTDIWSLGVVLYEMVTNSQPFTGATNSDVIASILQKEPPELSKEVPNRSALRSIFEKSLSKDRNLRYQTAGEFLDDLKKLKQHSETQPNQKRSITSQSVLPSSAGNRLIRFLPLVIVVALLSFAYYKFTRPRSEEKARPVPRVIPFTTF